MEIYFSSPGENNVSDDLAEALMKNVICNLRAAICDPEDYTARSNLLWDAAMAENRIIKLGKKTDFTCQQIENQIGAYTNCNHGVGLAVLQPMYCRHIYRERLEKFKRFAIHVWGVSVEGKSDEEIAEAGIGALTDFVKEIGLPATLQEVIVDERTDLKGIANSCPAILRGYKRMTSQEIFGILQKCYM